MAGLGNFFTWRDPEGNGMCGAMDAADLGLTSNTAGGYIGSTFQTIPKSHPGYDPVCDCYCWGYKPEPVRIIGVNGVRGMQGLQGYGPLGKGWKVCHPLYSSARRCPCSKDCPPAKAPDCPTCPPPPPPPPCPALPPPVTATGPEEEGGPEKFGVNVGLLAAGVLTAGVGYYGYKKGWFKRRR